MAKTESVKVSDSVEAKIVKEQAYLLACPRDGAVRFHKGEYIELRTDGSEVSVISEYRCVECNGTYQKESLTVTSRL